MGRAGGHRLDDVEYFLRLCAAEAGPVRATSRYVCLDAAPSQVLEERIHTIKRKGSNVVSVGTGGVSLTALIFAKAAGATTIITSSSDDKLEYVKANLGVDYTINYKTHPDWAAEVQRITNGEGVDHVIENGGAGTIKQSIASVAYGGVVSVIGFLAANVPQDKMPDVAMEALNKGCVVRGILAGSKQQLEEAVKYMGSRGLIIPVDKTFGFNRDEVIASLKYIESGKHIGKVCINVA